MDKQTSIFESMESKLRICQLACESLANIFSTEEDEEFDPNASNDTEQNLLRLLEISFTSHHLHLVLLGIAETARPQVSIASGLDLEWKLLQYRCLGALANMFLLMNHQLIVSCSINVSDIWNRLYSIQINSIDQETISSVFACLSALTGAVPLNSLIINYDHISTMINRYHQYPEIQVHIVGILGILAQYRDNVESNKVNIF